MRGRGGGGAGRWKQAMGRRSALKDYVRRSGASRCQRLLGRGRHWRSRRANDRYEFQYPTPYRLVGDVEPPLGEESSTSR